MADSSGERWRKFREKGKDTTKRWMQGIAQGHGGGDELLWCAEKNSGEHDKEKRENDWLRRVKKMRVRQENSTATA